MKIFKNKLAVTTIVLSVTFLIIIGYSASKKQNITVLNGAGGILGKINGGFYSIGASIKGTVSSITSYKDIEKENEELKKKNAELELKVIGYNYLLDDNNRLRSMLDFKKQRQEFNYVGADILGKGTTGYVDTFIVNKGSKDGIVKGLAVITDAGLVGQVTDVYSTYCEIQTIGSENISVAAYATSLDTKSSSTVSNSSAAGSTTSNEVPNGILKGIKTTNLSEVQTAMLYVPLTAQVKIGDVSLTSGLGMVYPKDIRIGKVTKIEEDKGKAMKTLYITPYVDFKNLNELIIVLPKDPIPKDGSVQYKG